MSTPAFTNGHLPMGRWVCTLAEAEQAYVPIDPADPRRQIWDQWIRLTEALRRVAVDVAACWLSGSFFTDKPVPGDLDCLYVIDTARLADVSASGDPARIGFVRAVSQSRVKALYGLPVDSYVLEWIPTPGPSPTAVGAQNYLELRGYWHDLWVRIRDSDPRLDSIPRRGYLEVIIDGYR
jgi:Family of unknown function (DUF6932)